MSIMLECVSNHVEKRALLDAMRKRTNVLNKTNNRMLPQVSTQELDDLFQIYDSSSNQLNDLLKVMKAID